ncbi:unnamed protein product [Trifolium pratense]|uniref:Uncharacterized protein n=1 Tax=Trifolium pratense TaxID=57577 RepID=A0ACB0INL8_TRIPR|nr:unnamed protein product [Trifolium pratense]
MKTTENSRKFLIVTSNFHILFDDLYAAKLRWPTLFDNVDSATEDWIVEQMITVNNLIMASFVLFYLVITDWLFILLHFRVRLCVPETTNFVAGLNIYASFTCEVVARDKSFFHQKISGEYKTIDRGFIYFWCRSLPSN